MSDTLPFRAQINQTRVEVWLGNIIDANTDAIVNAANTSLLGGGGVDGAIHRAAGPELVAECRRYHGCKVGQAKITRGYNLKAAYVIHAVGPVYGVANDSDLLASAYHSSFNLTMQHPIKTIAFPAISTGAYQYPLDEAAEIALTVTYNFVREKTHLEKVQFILFTQTALTAFARALKTLIDENTDIQRLD